MEAAVNTLSAEYGTLFVVAAGNFGADASVGSPGSADSALTVGAVDRDDNLADFSSRGPRTGDGAIKPDVTAPGVDIVAALHSDGTIGTPVEPGYTALSGTSMATPHVAGAAALLAQQHPDHTGAQLKALLTASATPNPDLTAFEQGAGRVDVARAITQQVVTEPTNVSIGTVQWPHDDDVPIGKPLTYRNLGDTDVTLALTLDTDAPAGMFSLSANEITVPAGGTAEVTVTGDAGAGGVDGYHSGAVVATDGESVTRTPVALDREVESYDLTIDMIDTTGAPTAAYSLRVYGHDSDRLRFPYDEDGSVEVRLPKGRYLIAGTVDDAPRYSLTVQPNLVLDRDTTVTVDARESRPVSVTPPAEATLLLAEIGYAQTTGDWPLMNSFLTDDLSTISTKHLGEPLPGTAFTANINTQWLADDGAYYGLAWSPHGSLPTGFTKIVRHRDVATLRADHGPAAPGRVGIKQLIPSPVGGVGFEFGIGLEIGLPGARTEYVTTEGVRWRSALHQFDGAELVAQLESPVRAYRAGHTYDVRLNHSVFGPASPAGGDWFTRQDNTVTVAPPQFSDGAGNAGTSATGSASVLLYRDGELIGESDTTSASFEVPAEDAEYRAVVTATRPAFDVSTTVSAEWTFRSAYGTPLAVSALRFTPRLDADNAAPAGVPYLVPTTLQHNGSVARPRSLTVEVSYDEGRTWQRARTVLNLAAVLHHPADAETVSLRATATDRHGGEVTETVLNAYKLRK